MTITKTVKMVVKTVNRTGATPPTKGGTLGRVKSTSEGEVVLGAIAPVGDPRLLLALIVYDDVVDGDDEVDWGKGESGSSEGPT